MGNPGTMLKQIIPPDFDGVVRLLMVVGAIVSFFWGVFVWNSNLNLERIRIAAEAELNAQTRKIEATKPFLNMQLALYQEAVQLASVISTTDPSTQRQESIQKLMRLYWGKLAMVENKEVETAMVALRNTIIAEEKLREKLREELKELSEELKEVLGEELRQKALDLARACRRSLDQSWGINAWTQR